jgi:NAD(P)-dependent dehydrogenase (short-subunit alcohol dehydrogenase family)
LEGRVALITGASSGLGARFTQIAVDAGAFVVVTARRSDRLNELWSDLADRVTMVPGDMTDPAHREALIDSIKVAHGRLDLLVNNAGICDDGPLEDQTLSELTEVLDLNLVAVLDLCRLAAPLLFAAERSSVINVSSVYGLVSSKNAMAAYNTSKGALVHFTRHMAAQWGDRGVRVNALAPGYFPTELTGNLAGPEFVKTVTEGTLLRRAPDISEIDGPFLFLASDASSYVTGHTLVVDAGWMVT